MWRVHERALAGSQDYIFGARGLQCGCTRNRGMLSRISSGTPDGRPQSRGPEIRAYGFWAPGLQGLQYFAVGPKCRPFCPCASVNAHVKGGVAAWDVCKHANNVWQVPEPTEGLGDDGTPARSNAGSVFAWRRSHLDVLDLAMVIFDVVTRISSCSGSVRSRTFTGRESGFCFLVER